MFERYNEQARRALFFARYEVSELGGLEIRSEHLLLGLLRDGRQFIARVLARCDVSLEDIRRDLKTRLRSAEKVATSVEIPFGADAKRALKFAVEEADRLQHRHIGPEHLLLGLARDEQSTAGAIFAARGLRLDGLRAAILELFAEHGPSLAEGRDSRAEQIFHIQHLVKELAAMAPERADAEALANRIDSLLDDLLDDSERRR